MNPTRLLQRPLSLPLVLLLAIAATAALLLAPARALAQNTYVRVQTTQGPIDVRLLDGEAPRTVANFLGYVRAGDYTDTLIHRSAHLPSGTPFVIQGGGYRWPATGSVTRITTRPPVANEFSAARSNLRGTVAMAKLGTSPDSATSEWFVNMGNNAGNLDNQNGGFTVFGRVTAPGMAVADRIAALRKVNAGSPFDDLPVFNFTSGQVNRGQVVLVTQVAELNAASEADRVFNWLEASYPEYLQPSNGQAGEVIGYRLRYYAGSNAYIGTKDGEIYYLVPSIGPDITRLGNVTELLAQAVAAGY